MRTLKIVSRLSVCAFVYSAVFAQAHASTLTGCLSGGRDGFSLTVDRDRWYRLTGNTSDLARYVYKQISVEGEEDVSTQLRPGDTRRSFKVIRFKAFETPKPSLSPSFTKSSSWHSETNPEYGIEFTHPDALSRISASESRALQANFVADQNIATVARFSIPREIYPNTNFVGGLFAMFVNPEIRNSQSCSEFGNYVPRFRSSYRAGNILYSTMKGVSISTGSADEYRYFHTFQNGLCYELAFDLVEISTGNYDLGCTIPVIREEDELNLIEPLLSRVAFVRPTIAVASESNPNAAPRITKFEASSKTADNVANRGQITFPWSTQDADYVEFSYRCVPAPHGSGVVILQSGGCCECENSTLRLNGGPSPNHSPNGSQSVLFGNHLQSEPISITVTLTPFSRAKPYHDSSKSLSIQVEPYNPFPEGVPVANGNLIVTYSASTGGTGNYKQGSSMTIRWKDTLPPDPCVDLYLVQDDGRGGQKYRCKSWILLSPARSGSYKWTIPEKYFGSGYRIFARTPGGSSSGLGPSFSITQANPTHN